MKKALFLLITSTLMGLNSYVSTSPKAGAAPQQPGQHHQSFQRAVTHVYSGQYLVYLPKDYKADGDRRWPLILFLHGIGERGQNLELVKKHGPPKIVESKPDFPFIVVSPQCPDGQWWSNEVLIALLDEIEEKYAVDRRRVYLTGLSMGGFGSWSLALAYPERFAAVAPICGGGNPFPPRGHGPERTQALKELPFWVFHGARDEAVKLEESTRMVEGMRRYGCMVEFTIYPEANHDSWTETYNNPELYEWFLKQQRHQGKTTN